MTYVWTLLIIFVLAVSTACSRQKTDFHIHISPDRGSGLNAESSGCTSNCKVPAYIGYKITRLSSAGLDDEVVARGIGTIVLSVPDAWNVSIPDIKLLPKRNYRLDLNMILQKGSYGTSDDDKEKRYCTKGTSYSNFEVSGFYFLSTDAETPSAQQLKTKIRYEDNESAESISNSGSISFTAEEGKGLFLQIEIPSNDTGILTNKIIARKITQGTTTAINDDTIYKLYLWDNFANKAVDANTMCDEKQTQKEQTGKATYISYTSDKAASSTIRVIQTTFNVNFATPFTLKLVKSTTEGQSVQESDPTVPMAILDDNCYTGADASAGTSASTAPSGLKYCFTNFTIGNSSFTKNDDKTYLKSTECKKDPGKDKNDCTNLRLLGFSDSSTDDRSPILPDIATANNPQPVIKYNKTENGEEKLKINFDQTYKTFIASHIPDYESSLNYIFTCKNQSHPAGTSTLTAQGQDINSSIDITCPNNVSIFSIKIVDKSSSKLNQTQSSDDKYVPVNETDQSCEFNINDLKTKDFTCKS